MTEFERDVIDRLARIETNQSTFSDFIENHTVEKKAALDRIQSLEDSRTRATGVVAGLSIAGGMLSSWLMRKLGL